MPQAATVSQVSKSATYVALVVLLLEHAAVAVVVVAHVRAHHMLQLIPGQCSPSARCMQHHTQCKPCRALQSIPVPFSHEEPVG